MLLSNSGCMASCAPSPPKKKARLDNSLITQADPTSRFTACPLCGRSFPKTSIMAHASSCTGNPAPPALDSKPRCDPKPAVPSASSWEDILKSPTSTASQPVPGLFIIPDFLTEDKEESLISSLLADDSPPFTFGSFNGPSLNKRWGVHCDLRSRRVGAPTHPLPPYLLLLMSKKLDKLNVPILKRTNWTMNEANAISYTKGLHHLDDHVDDRQLSREPIVNLSLCGDCHMTFIRVKAGKGLSKGEVGEERKVRGPAASCNFGCEVRAQLTTR